MKKNIVGLFFLVALTSKAQILKPFIYGAEISANQTSFSAKPNINNMTPELGYGAAAFCRLKILMLYAEIDAGYSSHSVTSITKVTGSPDVKGTFAMNGLDLSGIFGWRIFGMGKLGNMRLFAGYNYNNYSTHDYEVNNVKNSSVLGTSNQSVIGGLGFDVWKFVFNFKYYAGLQNICTASNQEIKTGMGVFSLGYKIN